VAKSSTLTTERLDPISLSLPSAETETQVILSSSQAPTFETEDEMAKPKSKAQAKSASKSTKAKSKTASTNKSAAKGRATKTKGKKTSVVKSMRESIAAGFDKVAEQVTSIFSTQPKDIVSAIKMDHEGLRNFMSLLKDTDKDLGERRRAYEQFSALLKSHTTAEENVVYARAEELTGREMHIKVAEGFVEHQLADDLMKRLEATTDPTEWSAHANVLSEIVEHHLDEEESDLLPLIDDATTEETDMEMLVSYMDARAQSQTKVTDKNAGVLKTLN
jgi:hemerythrin-like domain-containing protein